VQSRGSSLSSGIIDGSASSRAGGGGGRAGAGRTDLEEVACPHMTEGFDGAGGHGERPAPVAPSATRKIPVSDGERPRLLHPLHRSFQMHRHQSRGLPLLCVLSFTHAPSGRLLRYRYGSQPTAPADCNCVRRAAQCAATRLYVSGRHLVAPAPGFCESRACID
jgi:hypothetical protein